MEKNIETIKSRSIVRMGMGRKGVGIIAVAVVLMVSVIIIEGVIVNTFIVDMEVMKRTAREIAVINAIDSVEFAKKALQQAVAYSFYGASDGVLRAGGFCAFDENPCEEDCKVPNNVPSRDCTPWWRVYETTYAPEYGMPSEPQLEPESGTFAYYLFSRMSAVFNSYGSSFLSPIYCPRPPGKVTIEDMGAYRIRANITNIEGDAIEYKADNLEIAEYNTYFSDAFGASTLELFEFARSKFVDNDPVKSAFISADNSMPNSWCEMDAGYCDVTVDCEADPYENACFRDSKPYTNCCWDDGDCGCEAVYLGERCESDVGESDEEHLAFCESRLDIYCRKEDKSRRRNDECNFDRDDYITADEKYKCTVQNNLKSIYSADGIFEASVETYNCIKVGHDAAFSSTSLGFEEVGWDESCGCKLDHWKIDCGGIAKACSDITTSSDCNYDESDPQYGCYWYTQCSGGPPNDCSAYDNKGSGTCRKYCSGASYTRECKGTATACEDISYRNCNNQPGCSPSGSECTGDPPSNCEHFSSDPEDCKDQLGCRLVGFECIGEPLPCVGRSEGGCDWPCDWEEGTCGDDPGVTSCDDRRNADCEDGYGCDLHGDCSGTPYDCSHFTVNRHASKVGEDGDKATCEYAGCSWSGDCRGTAIPCTTWDKSEIENKPTCDNKKDKCADQIGCSVGCDRDSDCCDLRPGEGEVDDYGNCENYGCYCDPQPSGWQTTYRDVKCTYDYFGSADATVIVKDVVHKYPIGSSWSSLEMFFNVVSGNAEDCSGDVETETCCQAAATNELDVANGCKTETSIETEEPATPTTTTPGCTIDSDCCEQLEITGARVVCLNGVCEPATIGGFRCPL